jgi:hypothetical protein
MDRRDGWMGERAEVKKCTEGIEDGRNKGWKE